MGAVERHARDVASLWTLEQQLGGEHDSQSMPDTSHHNTYRDGPVVGRALQCCQRGFDSRAMPLLTCRASVRKAGKSRMTDRASVSTFSKSSSAPLGMGLLRCLTIGMMAGACRRLQSAMPQNTSAPCFAHERRLGSQQPERRASGALLRSFPRDVRSAPETLTRKREELKKRQVRGAFTCAIKHSTSHSFVANLRQQQCAAASLALPENARLGRSVEPVL